MLQWIPEKRDFDLVGLGEIMLRFSPTGYDRLSQCETMERRPGGSELNIASGGSLLGLRTSVVTKLPDNDLGRFVKNQIRFYGVSDDYLVYGSGPEQRVGVYYYESGAYPRKPSVIYDRRGSSFNTLCLDEVDEGIYASARVFHTSGITLAVSEPARRLAVEMIGRFKEQGTAISFDVNYRANLWSEEEARRTVEEILPLVDILFVSEETSRRMMARTGTLEQIMRGYCKQYGVQVVACTNRTVISPKCHSFNSTIYCAQDESVHIGKPYENIDVIDRVGSGDAYVAGVLYGLLGPGTLEAAMDYGNAMAAVKNTVVGDMLASNYEEISRVVKMHRTGGGGEMNR